MCRAHGCGLWLALVGTGWIISHLVTIDELRNYSSPLVEVPFPNL